MCVCVCVCMWRSARDVYSYRLWSLRIELKCQTTLFAIHIELTRLGNECINVSVKRGVHTRQINLSITTGLKERNL